jgi:coenzyme Q-binding protein COQ10
VSTHRETVVLPYRAGDLFDLASDVARYPEFIPWIKALKVSDRRDGEGRMQCRAEASVGFKGFSETFVTDVDARRDGFAIDVSLVRGPFRKLRNTWRMAAQGDTTRVDFSIEFEFRNFVLQALADANRAYAVRRVIDAFVKEAGRRYASTAA